jgi:hypothetical protein
VGVDLFNALNADTAIPVNRSFNPAAAPKTWLAPTKVLSLRFHAGPVHGRLLDSCHRWG